MHHKKYKIYSLRNNPAWGNHWVHERDCTVNTVQEWLAIFRNDEPGVTFIGTTRKPNKP